MTEPAPDDIHSHPRFIVRHRMSIVLTLYAAIFASALAAAFMLAYNFHWTQMQGDRAHRWFFELYLPLLAVSLPVKLLTFHWTGQYRGSWRYVGLRDLFDVISASLIASFFFLTVYFIIEYWWRFRTGSFLIDSAPMGILKQSSVFALDWAATIVFVSAARVLVRFYYEDLRSGEVGTPTRVLIIGASDSGEAVLRQMLRTPGERYECAGFLDDDVSRLHGRIHGVEVVGRTEDIRTICLELEIQEVLITLPRVTPKTIRTLVERCQGTGVVFRTIPDISDVIEGRVQVSRIRKVEIADLLGRDPVQLDTDLIGAQLCGKRALVTGAGGSIGSEMCRQIASYKPERLILVERAENNLFEIERELRAKHPGMNIVPYIADVGDRPRLKTIFETQRPSTVFHAAAHKHVPMMECNSGEAVKNNIGGTAAVADVSRECGVAKVVVISTDKAVNPTSIMGCTKRVAEMYVQGLRGAEPTQFVTVRFGNVLGSSGSVVPIFEKQIAQGGPVTVTHADMQRYFMTIAEAAQLVLQAGTMGKGGEIYVLHMGKPVRIVDLARDMITLSGLRPDVDIDIVFSGVRPGEKLFEELSNEGEDYGDTAHPKIGIWKHRPEDPQFVQDGMKRLIQMADAGNHAAIQVELKLLVPEYTPDQANGSTPHVPPVADSGQSSASKVSTA